MKSLPKIPEKVFLQTLEASNFVKILKIARFARLTNSELINDEDWIFLANVLINDFPEMTIEEANEIIKKGIKGKIGDIYQPLNFTKIYRWFEQEYQSPEEKTHQEQKEKYAIRD